MCILRRKESEARKAGFRPHSMNQRRLRERYRSRHPHMMTLGYLCSPWQEQRVWNLTWSSRGTVAVRDGHPCEA